MHEIQEPEFKVGDTINLPNTTLTIIERHDEYLPDDYEYTVQYNGIKHRMSEFTLKKLISKNSSSKGGKRKTRKGKGKKGRKSRKSRK